MNDNDKQNSTNSVPESQATSPSSTTNKPTATRHNLQLGRRIFHFSCGCLVATLYHQFIEHQKVVYTLGIVATTLYVLEQIRISYPEIAQKVANFTNFILRAEEQLKESSAIPYAFALLLTILSFPKMVAVIAIYTLAIADPLSAIVGILYGKHKIIQQRKSWEGSLAFFLATLASCFYVIYSYHPNSLEQNVKASLTIAVLATGFEIIPLRLDDNLTIPLTTAAFTWITCYAFGIPLHP